MPQFVAMINEIEAELSIEYVGGAIRWCDEKFGNAWSNAIDRFDKALTTAADRQDWTLARIEGDFYKNTVLGLLRKYKAAKGVHDTESFLDALKSV